MSITRRHVCPDIREPADVRRSWGSPEPSIRLCMSPHTQPDGTSQAMTLVPICATSLQKGRRHDARRRIAGTRPEEQQTPGEPGVNGVDNAARTRDLLNHNQMLYRLSYIHHVVWNPRNSRFRTTLKDYTRYQGRPLLGESFFRQTLPRNAISASSSRSAPAPSQWNDRGRTAPHTQCHSTTVANRRHESTERSERVGTVGSGQVSGVITQRSRRGPSRRKR